MNNPADELIDAFERLVMRRMLYSFIGSQEHPRVVLNDLIFEWQDQTRAYLKAIIDAQFKETGLVMPFDLEEHLWEAEKRIREHFGRHVPGLNGHDSDDPNRPAENPS